MTALPLSILALAAGVYLLIKVNREYLGGLFKFLAWLIILLSLLSTVAAVRHGIHHFRKHHGFEHCGMNGGCMHGEMSGACSMDQKCNAGKMADGACPMSGCKMAGDSVILDKAVCEKMMGKEACDSICKLRGQCILTKDECAKMCSAGGKECCAMGKGDGKEMKCCKKK